VCMHRKIDGLVDNVNIYVYICAGRSKSCKTSASEVAQSNKEKFLKYLDDPTHTKHALMRLLRMTRMRGQPLPPPGTRITCFTPPNDPHARATFASSRYSHFLLY